LIVVACVNFVEILLFSLSICVLAQPCHPLSTSAMARGSAAASSPSIATPASGALKRSTSSTQNMKNQKSILGFFQKSSPSTPSTAPRNAEPASSPAQRASENKASTKTKKGLQNLTPVPSSDVIEPDEDELSAKKAGYLFSAVV
jgi:DNA mismatch repair protein MSH6